MVSSINLALLSSDGHRLQKTLAKLDPAFCRSAAIVVATVSARIFPGVE